MQPPPEPLVNLAITLLVACFVGLGVLWFLAYFGELISKPLLKALPFLALSVLIGWIAIAAFKQLFS